MPSSYTALGFEKQAAGENLNTWGANRLNDTIDRINYAIAGYLAIAITGDTTLTSSNSTAVATNFQARNALIKFTGALGANSTITVPSTAMQWMMYNATNKVLTITTGSGGTVTIDSGDTVPLFCDGTNVRQFNYGGLGMKDYIAAVAWASVGTLPAQLGNSGKFIRTDGTNATWQFVANTDIVGLSASAAVTRVGTSTAAALTPGDTYGALAEVALTSTAASVALDMSTFINAYHLFTENTTFANPTNVKPGQTGYIRVQQHASSAKTGAMGSNWKRAGGTVAFSTTLSGFDFIVYQAITSTYILYDIVKNPS